VLTAIFAQALAGGAVLALVAGFLFALYLALAESFV